MPNVLGILSFLISNVPQSAWKLWDTFTLHELKIHEKNASFQLNIIVDNHDIYVSHHEFSCIENSQCSSNFLPRQMFFRIHDVETPLLSMFEHKETIFKVNFVLKSMKKCSCLYRMYTACYHMTIYIVAN